MSEQTNDAAEMSESPDSQVDPATQQPIDQPSTEVPATEASDSPVEAPVEEHAAEAAAEAPAETQADVAPATATDSVTSAEPAVELNEAEKAEQAAKREEERKRKEEERKQRDEAYATLESFKAAGTSFEVTISERVKGGLRGEFNGLRIFLPASHFGVRKNVTEEDLNSLLGQTVRVKVHELQSDDTGYKSAVVTRRDILLDEFWNGIQQGSVFEGVVSSVTTFGAFVNIGGVEGLVHVSRLSRSRVEKPSEVVKKGDKLKVTVSEVDREKRKLSLSHKEHEADPWTGAAARFTVGTKLKGTVRRITDFGAYVQVAPKIEGLLRISELSWTRRVKHPSEVINVDQEIDVVVLSTNEEKHQLALGYKQTLENPWLSLTSTLPLGSETQGVVQNVSTQGAVVRVADAFDGFMPRSKILNAGRGQKVQLNAGDSITCVVVDCKPENASLILAMKGEDGSIGGQQQDDSRSDRGDRGDRSDRGDRGDRGPAVNIPAAPGVTLGDMLKDASILKQ